MVVNRPLPFSRARKKILAISAAAVAAVAIAGGAYSLSRSGGTTPLPRPATAETTVVQPRPQPTDAPRGEEQIRTSVPVSDAPPPVQQTHVLRFNLGVEGVDVLRGQETVCTTTASGSCSLTLPAGTDPITFAFRKQGFRPREISVAPDADRIEDVQLEAEERARPPRTRPSGTPRQQRPRQQGPVIITSPD